MVRCIYHLDQSIYCEECKMRIDNNNKPLVLTPQCGCFKCSKIACDCKPQGVSQNEVLPTKNPSCDATCPNYRDGDEEITRLNAEVEKLKYEGKKDYEGMREFQSKFIQSDHQLREVQISLDEAQGYIEWQEKEITRLKQENESLSSKLSYMCSKEIDSHQGCSSEIQNLRDALVNLNLYMDDIESNLMSNHGVIMTDFSRVRKAISEVLGGKE
jgi:chromosome segregation ATPase